jgi:pimeloyl-ACP methyl ester carboxylesterase
VTTSPLGSPARHRRRTVMVAAVALACGAVLAACGSSNATPAQPSGTQPEEVGSVTSSPQLPSGFASIFEDRFVEANGIRQHVVVGGDGPPLLLVHGWPENWYAWRDLMPTLAEDFTVIAVDQRGIGLTDKPTDGYDAGTLGDDLAELMTELGHEQFAVVGHDTGYIISYALAADHPDRVVRLVVAEIPGPPGVGEAPPLFIPEPLNNRLWHIPFNRVNDDLIVDMVSADPSAFYAYEYAIQGGGATLPDHVQDYYVDLYTRDTGALRASFGLYRAWDVTVQQNGERAKTKLTMPVLGIGGENSWGPAPGEGMRPAAVDVQTVVLPGSGHWVAEQAPDQMLEALSTFLEPYLTAAVPT